MIGPLGLTRTTWLPQAPKAQGYLVEEYTRTVMKEPETDLGAVAAMGQLWSTVEDLATWATFLARGDEAVLDAKVVERMWFPQVMYYPDEWILGWGLGLELYNHEGKIYGGHGGAMAGHLSAVYINRKTQIGAAAVTNSGTRANMDLLCLQLATKAMELWPEPIEAWRPGGAAGRRAPAPRPVVVGGDTSSCSGGSDGTLQAKVVGTGPAARETTFERDGDGWRASAGRERGERLRVDGDRLIWAGYAFTRAQEPFSS